MWLPPIADRLANRVQLTTDGHKPYLMAVDEVFGADSIDYAILQKLYGQKGVARTPTRATRPAS